MHIKKKMIQLIPSSLILFLINNARISSSFFFYSVTFDQSTEFLPSKFTPRAPKMKYYFVFLKHHALISSFYMGKPQDMWESNLFWIHVVIQDPLVHISFIKALYYQISIIMIQKYLGDICSNSCCLSQSEKPSWSRLA